MAAVDRGWHGVLLLAQRALLAHGVLVLEGVVGELRRVVRGRVAVAGRSIEGDRAVSLVANSGLALEAAGQVGRVGEHPGLAGGRLAGRRRTEGSVATGSGRAGELAREVDGEGAQTLLLVRLRAAPARLLLDEGVRRRRRRRRGGRGRGSGAVAAGPDRASPAHLPAAPAERPERDHLPSGGRGGGGGGAGVRGTRRRDNFTCVGDQTRSTSELRSQIL